MAKFKTKKDKERSLRLSNKNNDSRFFSVEGVRFECVGTKQNTNGSWSICIKNLDMDRGADRFKWVGAETVEKLLSR